MKSPLKVYGAKALLGTPKQKSAAEKVRAEKVNQLKSVEDAALVCDPKALTSTAEFWIKNRHRSIIEIVKFVKDYKELLKKAKHLKESGDYEQYSHIAVQYNELTSAWGF